MKSLRRSIGYVLVCVVGCATTSWAQSGFTLEQILSAPFSDELVSSTHSNRVAWVFDIRGVRNVWIADGPDFTRTARQLTHYEEDDGQSIASVRLTPDGKTVVYALGTELNGAQESANPTSSTSGAKQQVFSVNADAKDAAPQLLGDMGCGEEGCEDIEISPDGKWVLWPAKKKLWLASIDGKQQAKELANGAWVSRRTEMVTGRETYRVRQRPRRSQLDRSV